MLTFVRVRVVFDNFAICDPIFKPFLSLEPSLFDLEFLTSLSSTKNVSKTMKMLTFVRVRVVFGQKFAEFGRELASKRKALSPH